MKLAIVFVVSAIYLSSTTAQQYSMSSVDPSQTVASRLSTFVVEAISRGARFLFELFDIKVRSVRFLASLYTTDNLVLLKKIMNVGLRFGNWLYAAIPNSTAEGQQQYLSFLFPQVDLENKNEEDTQVNNFQFESSEMESGDNGVSGSDDNGMEQDRQYDSYGQVVNLDRLINGHRY